MEIQWKKFCYKIEGNEIEFRMYEDFFPEVMGNSQIFVSGSFNGWICSADSSWKLDKKISKGKTFFTLKKDFSKINIPGNSGFPEFNFIMVTPEEIVYLKDNLDDENSFKGNRVVLNGDDEIAELKTLYKSLVKEDLKEIFDMNCPACRADFSNIRIATGTKCLFRGYHPYKKSFVESDAEEIRLTYVAQTVKNYGIKSVITLSGYEMPSEKKDEKMPLYIEEIEKKGDRLCLNINFLLSYYHTDAAEFLNDLRKICLFIIEHPGPYYIHCRLGNDMTGIVCAVISALCGATWNHICADFEKSNSSGIGEYRNKKLLLYAIRKMIGYNPTDSKDLAYLMQSYFIKEKILSAAEIQNLIEKLNVPSKKKETDFFNFEETHICAKRSAKI